MLCSRCGKRPAVVFVSTNNPQDEATKGYCLTCAKELGIKPVEDLINKMGISDDDLENVQDQMDSLMENMGENGDLSQLMQQLGADNLAESMGELGEDGGSEDDDFSHGAPTFPAFFNNIFGAKTVKTIPTVPLRAAAKRKRKKIKTENTSTFIVRILPERQERAKLTILSAEIKKLSVLFRFFHAVQRITLVLSVSRV